MDKDYSVFGLVMVVGWGKKKDDQLSLSSYRFVNEGNVHISASRLKRILFHLTFRTKETKEMNMVGMQMADLAAYPIALHIIDPKKSNPSYDIGAKILRRKWFSAWFKGIPLKTKSPGYTRAPGPPEYPSPFGGDYNVVFLYVNIFILAIEFHNIWTTRKP